MMTTELLLVILTLTGGIAVSLWRMNRPEPRRIRITSSSKEYKGRHGGDNG